MVKLYLVQYLVVGVYSFYLKTLCFKDNVEFVRCCCNVGALFVSSFMYRTFFRVEIDPVSLKLEYLLWNKKSIP